MSLSKIMMKEEVVVGILGSVAAVSFLVSYFPQTFIIDTYYRYYQKYSPGQKVVYPSEQLQNQFQEVLSDLEFREAHKKCIKLFICNSLNIFYAGSSKSLYGIRIGLPEHYNYTTKEEVEQSIMKIDGEQVDWNSEYGKMLADALVLSDNAKRYAIAKHIHLLNNYNFQFSSLIPTLLAGVLYSLCVKLNKLLKLSTRPTPAVVYVYTIMAGAFYVLYRILRDNLCMLYDRSAEDATLKMGRQYILAAIEYYDKLIARNVAFRNLMKNGKKYYTPTGNEVYFISQRSLPLSYKKLYVEGVLKKEYEEDAAREIPTPREPIDPMSC